MLARTGRPPKPNADRFPCGRPREEKPEDVMGVAIAARVRHGLPFELSVVRDSRTGNVTHSNPDAGHTLGLLRLRGASDPGGISDAQYHAGIAYGLLCQRHATIMGYSTGSPKSPGFELVAGGFSVMPDPDDQVVFDVRRKWSDCLHVLQDAGMAIGQASRVATVTYDACLDRIAFTALQADDVARGNLKVGLNSLARVLR